MSKFKLGLTIVFSAFIIIGVIIFAASKGSGSTPAAQITIWGFLPKQSFDQFVSATAVGKDKTLVVTYVQENPASFENDFVNALANGAGPDVVMISQDMVAQNQNKLLTIPYANYSERTFKDSFVQEGELFLNKNGVVAVPFVIDPLVLYWNRDIFSSAGVSLPPKYFDELLTLPSQLSQTDKSGNFTQSAVALGEWGNVRNAKAIFSDMLLSAGSSVVDTTGTTPRSTLTDTTGAISPAEASLDFYTQFANPTKQTYSWNRSLPNSLDYFLSGNLAMYFGFASELATIRAKNPNLNFDVTAMLQSRQAVKKISFATIYGLAIVKQSKNASAAFKTITELTTDDSINTLESYTNLPPVKRSLLATAPTDPYKAVFHQSALVSAGWFDPDGAVTDAMFQNMVESVTSGRARTSEAVNSANDKMNSLFR